MTRGAIRVVLADDQVLLLGAVDVLLNGGGVHLDAPLSVASLDATQGHGL